MTKVDIFSGFLGAGKTTLIKKLLSEVCVGQKIVLIENEFGQIGIDGGFLKEAGIQVTEMNSGCICCSLVGDFVKALEKVIDTYNPDRILIEPSGVGKLSDVSKAVADCNGTEISSMTTIADVTKFKLYLKNFKEFYSNQIENASTIVLSRTQSATQDRIDTAINLIREINKHATIITTPWDQLTGSQIFDAMINTNSLDSMAEELLHEHEHEHECGCCCHEHHEHHEHHHDDECKCTCTPGHHDENCTCGCNDPESDHECECGCGCDGHHEHHHDDECKCTCTPGHHDENCTCGCNDPDSDHECECGCGCGEHHEHHHEHHADEVFDSIGFETSKAFSRDELETCLSAIEDEGKFGLVLRAKGIVPSSDGKWFHFDFVPGEIDIRYGSSDVIGKLCIIGSEVDKDEIKKLFNI